jgi:FixJ family two-component response regulator
MPDARVYVVDDDAALRRSVRFLLESVGWQVVEFPSGSAFLAGYDEEHAGCALIDVRMPGLSGLEVLSELRARCARLPAIFLTGHADVALAVEVMKSGAFDLLEKPYRDQALLDAVSRAVREHEQRLRQAGRREAIDRLYAQLTSREREVAREVARGRANKEIARLLGISEKTVHVHRANLLEKLNVHGAAQLTQLLMRLDPAFVEDDGKAATQARRSGA